MKNYFSLVNRINKFSLILKIICVKCINDNSVAVSARFGVCRSS